MLPNANSFEDLCAEDQALLLSYIEASYQPAKTLTRSIQPMG